MGYNATRVIINFSKQIIPIVLLIIVGNDSSFNDGFKIRGGVKKLQSLDGTSVLYRLDLQPFGPIFRSGPETFYTDCTSFHWAPSWSYLTGMLLSVYLLPHTTWRNPSMSDSHQRLSTSFKSIHLRCRKIFRGDYNPIFVIYANSNFYRRQILNYQIILSINVLSRWMRGVATDMNINIMLVCRMDSWQPLVLVQYQQNIIHETSFYIHSARFCISKFSVNT